MKLFLTIFGAILAAAFVITIVQSFDKLSRKRAYTAALEEASDAMKKRTNEIEQERAALWQETVRSINAMPEKPKSTPAKK